MNILKRVEFFKDGTVSVNSWALVDGDGTKTDDFYKHRSEPEEPLSISAVTKEVKRNGLQSARDLIQKRQAAEDKLLITKGKRSAHHALGRVSEVPEIMDVDDEAT